MHNRFRALIGGVASELLLACGIILFGLALTALMGWV